MAQKTKDLQRLDKVVAHLTGLSRQVVTKQLIKPGLVSLDGEVLSDPKAKVHLDDQLMIEGYSDDIDTAVGDAFSKRVFMLNKPRNYVCADRDRNFATVPSLLRDEVNVQDLHCVGRLDVDTTGLILVTDDGELNHNITSPKKAINKLYFAHLAQPVRKNSIKTFANGIKHPQESKRYLPAILTLLPEVDGKLDFGGAVNSQDESHFACVQITEGRYHEVKRLFEVVGCEVVELSRLAIGKLTLDDEITLGAYRLLSPDDIELLFDQSIFEPEQLLPMVESFMRSIENSSAAFKLGLEHAAKGDGNVDDSRAQMLEVDGSFDDLDENGDIRIY